MCPPARAEIRQAAIENRRAASCGTLHLVYPAVYLVLALLVLNNAGRRAPYYFLDPDSIGTAAVVGNIGLLAAIFLALGYILMAVGRPTAPAGVDPG